jgi:hypothetical protein
MNKVLALNCLQAHDILFTTATIWPVYRIHFHKPNVTAEWLALLLRILEVVFFSPSRQIP